jgi:class 3 adenylate cyclase/tetratricopeptide (TPR) repeat protein
VRVCAQCSSELYLVCAQCGFEIPADFQFCGRCATPLSKEADADQAQDILIPAHAVRDIADKLLDSQERLGGERRNITVVFVDLSSFTQQSETLDPEDVYVVVGDYLRLLVDQIHRFGGHVDKFTGDGIMALFGAPKAHENDPERALKAALAIQYSLKELEGKTRKTVPMSLQARIGVNSGIVVVGTVGTDISLDYTAMGDVVNVAARLETEAEPGSVLVSHTTYELTKSLFEFERVGPVQVKGRKTPVESYYLEREIETSGVSDSHGPIIEELIGRERELTDLKRASRRLIEDGIGGMVVIAGEAGIGKSSLIAQLRSDLPPGAVDFIIGETTPYDKSGPYFVFKRLFQRFFGVQDHDLTEDSRLTIDAYMGKLGSEQARIAQPYIEYLMGLVPTEETEAHFRHQDPKTLRQRTFLAVGAVMAAASAERPLIFGFEDLHWIDELSLELILFLLNHTNQYPILFIATSRLEEQAVLARLDEIARAKLNDHYLRIELQPLSRSESLQLAQARLDLHELPEQIKTLITTKAEGNPFFTVQLVEALVDKDVITRGEDWELSHPDGRLTEIDIPITLDGLIMSRVDSLGEKSRRVLQIASVLGRQFSRKILGELLKVDAAELDTQVGGLAERRLLFPSQEGEMQVYEFQHGLLRDCVYNSLLIRRRKDLHGQAALAIEQIEPEFVRNNPELMAHHYLNSNTSVDAIPHLIIAGDHGRLRYANNEALQFFEQARSLLKEADSVSLQQQIEIYSGLGEAYTFTGIYQDATDAYESALTLLEGQANGGMLEELADLQRQMGRVFERQGDYDTAEQMLNAAIETLDSADLAIDSIGRAQVFNELGWLQLRQGKYEQASGWIHKALPILEKHSSTLELASAFNRLVALNYNQGNLEQALENAQKGLEIRREMGDLYGIANSNNNLGALMSNTGDWDQALTHLEDALDLYRKLGYADGIISAQSNMAVIVMGRGDHTRAELLLQEALQLARGIDNAWLVASILHRLGERAILTMEPEKVFVNLEESLQIANDAGAIEVESEASWRMAWAYLQLGKEEEAQEWVEKAIELAEKSGSKEALGNSLRIQGTLQRIAEQVDKAEESLCSSIDILEALGNRYEVARSQLEVGHMYALKAKSTGDVDATRSAKEMFEAAIQTFQDLKAGPSKDIAEWALITFLTRLYEESIEE